MEVWVAETWGPHGDGAGTFGVFSSREAAFEKLKTEPNTTVWVDDEGIVRVRPRKEGREWQPPYLPQRWGYASALEVQGDESLMAVAGRDRSYLTDALMVLMKKIESVPENDLSEMPELQRLLNRLMGHQPDEFPYQPAGTSGSGRAVPGSPGGDSAAGDGATTEDAATP